MVTATRDEAGVAVQVLGETRWLLVRRPDGQRAFYFDTNRKLGENGLTLTAEEWALISKPLEHFGQNTTLVERDGWRIVYVDGLNFGHGWLGIGAPQGLTLVLGLPEWFRAVRSLADYQYSVIGIGDDGEFAPL